MINREIDKRLEQYLTEKSMLERYGQVSSITYEQWLEIKGFTKKNYITMKSNELKFVNDRCKLNFEKAFGKIAECCGLSEKIRNAGAAEEFQDFMMSIERFYLRKMNYKQKYINKLVHELKEKK